MSRCVWAFQPLDELKQQTGFVECDDDIAERLLAADKVQDPQIGGHLLREIVEAKPVAPEPAPEYQTKVVEPVTRRRR